MMAYWHRIYIPYEVVIRPNKSADLLSIRPFSWQSSRILTVIFSGAIHPL